MQPSNKPKEHLARAKAHVEAFATAPTLEDAEHHWKSFLQDLERCWFKAEAHYGRSPKWNGWAAKYRKARETDPLLAYLRRARDAQEHTIADITSRVPGSITMAAADPQKPAYMSEVIVHKDGTVSGVAENLKVEVTSPSLGLLPVTNRGKSYPIPTSHLGQPFHGRPVALAECGLAYYAELLDAADAFLLK
ncbi:hypothetical protein [Aquabacterium sp. J223]|uniref:hypothetical protein n=1 Tax=Aquabacterium sp. J223 TaxID=2898431 RepID=UPI0021ADFE5F|nr:hypothetical protein [Aquabacterium sp. J223]UUX97464.1 hypothetical protein LRS07_09620 [Aquabacterium sp. J223]